jgi:hypothetical protein
VETDTWVRIGSDIEISYEVSPAQDDVVFTFDGLSLNMGQAALQRCVATFTKDFDASGVALAGR